mgnify:CR=1 FL=1
MAKQRILVLVHETLVPPDSLEGVREQDVAEYRTEYDVISCLRASGHDVRPIGIGDSLTELRATIQDWQPQVCFNLLEEFGGIVTYDQHVVAYLELLRQSYTGCNPRGMMLSRDKVLSKQILSYHRIPTPQFAVFRQGAAIRIPARLRYPLFVKSATEDASLGISQASFVETDEQFKERVQFIHERVGTAAIVEQFIDGRELYVGVAGNDRLRVFPVWEMSFARMPDNRWRIATERVKWSDQYQKRHGVTTDAAVLPDADLARIAHIAKRAYRALDLSGYARIDLRMDASGGVYVLEANPNPNLGYGEDFAESAESAGTMCTATSPNTSATAAAISPKVTATPVPMFVIPVHVRSTIFTSACTTSATSVRSRLRAGSPNSRIDRPCAAASIHRLSAMSGRCPSPMTVKGLTTVVGPRRDVQRRSTVTLEWAYPPRGRSARCRNCRSSFRLTTNRGACRVCSTPSKSRGRGSVPMPARSR